MIPKIIPRNVELEKKEQEHLQSVAEVNSALDHFMSADKPENKEGEEQCVSKNGTR